MKKRIKYFMNDLLLLTIIGRWGLSKYRQLTEMELAFFGIFLVIVIIWFPLKERAEDKYKKGNNENDQLCKRGKKRIFLFNSELKGLCFRDIYVITQIVFMLIYGVYCSFYHLYCEKVFIIWTCIIILPCVLIEEYYEYILRKESVEKQSWGPYRYFTAGGRRADRTFVKYENFDEFIEEFRIRNEKQKFILQKKYALNQGGNCWIFTRRNRITLEVIGVVRIRKMHSEHIKELDDIFEDFFKRCLRITPIGYLVNCTYLLCVDSESSAFRVLLNNPVSQKGIRFRGINAGLSFETKKLYISKQEGIWGLRRYKKMKDILEKNLKSIKTG